MAKDYKNSRRNAGRSGGSMSTLAGFIVGLALGLGVAMAVYLYDRRPSSHIVAQNAAPMTRDEESKEKKPEKPAANRPENQYDFYEMLPKFEVVVPEQGDAPAPDVGKSPVEKPGAYILQAGSFRNHADADRVRALIAMQGVESKIQEVTIDKDTWHRVRVGPITNLSKLEETRGKLRQARIEALVIRVGE
jgi:cell division protein FtsN